jgi:hypothetical protein
LSKCHLLLDFTNVESIGSVEIGIAHHPT